MKLEIVEPAVSQATRPTAADGRVRIMILTPVMPPAAGGGAIYTQTLARHLVRDGHAAHVLVLTERHPGQPPLTQELDGRVHVRRLLPFRAGRSRRDVWSYLAYGSAQVILLALPWIAYRRRIDVLVVHSSFFYQAGILRFLVSAIRRLTSVRLVLDVRDPKLSSSAFSRNMPFHRVLACSRNVADALRLRPGWNDRVSFVPIPITVTKPADDLCHSEISSIGLKPYGYILNANGFLDEKNTPMLVDAVASVWQNGKRLPLVVVGRQRDWHRRYDELVQQGILVPLGPMPHARVLALMKKAALVVNPSAIESPSRTAIEALILGANVLLPPNVAEFETDCRDHICDVGSADRLSAQIDRALESDADPPRYDLTQHHPTSVAAAFTLALGHSRY